jgi:hypothetical protein
VVPVRLKPLVVEAALVALGLLEIAVVLLPVMVVPELLTRLQDRQ